MSPAPSSRIRHPRVVDTLLVVLTALVGLLAVRLRFLGPDPVPTWLLTLDLAAGVVACAALWWRRRLPLGVASAVIVASTFSEAVSLAALVALFTVAVHCSPRATAAATAGNLLALTVFFTLRPAQAVPWWALVTLILAGHAAVVSWGLLVRSRRQLIASLRERATLAEVEAGLRAERSQNEARETLAREMHDVLGHRLSLLSVHAGALAYHRGASADETARAAEVIRENAHLALQDLREVIGVLRAPVGELPLPDVTDVGELIEQTRRAGTPVELRDEPGVTTDGQRIGRSAGRTVYRLVQEGLTNARKHAPGAPLTVRITGAPGDHLAVEVTNPPPAASSPPSPSGPPGSGEGLRGLGERATLVGGRFDHGPTASGGWRVAMRLPWTT